jgi:uncharacterized membrane protein HdeD (DUF308 family)
MAHETSAAFPQVAFRFGRAPWWVLAIEGAVLVALGVLAVLVPFIASLAVAAIVGWIYLFAGGVRVVSSLTHRGPNWGWSLVIGVVAMGVGIFLLAAPVAGVVTLTLVLGAYFLADAISSFVMAATIGRHTGKSGWHVIAGVADLILAAITLFDLSYGALWLLGLVVAANLVFAGAALLTLGLTWRARAAT